MNPPAKLVYTPPRPNLGPEPLDASPPWTGPTIALVLTLLALVLWRLGRRSRRPRMTSQPPSLPNTPSDSPREHMIAWSISLRESLAAKFGPSWLAKTTEEIANDPALIAAIGPDQAARLTAFLAATDQTKFADMLDPPPSNLTDSELKDLTERITTTSPPSDKSNSSPVVRRQE